VIDKDLKNFNRAVEDAKIPPVTAAPKIGS
jgi:hypothetical protein